MKWIIFIVALYSCASQQPIVYPPTKPIFIHDTVTLPGKVIHDSIPGRTSYLLSDTSTGANTIYIHPLVGDNYQQLTDAINYSLATPGASVQISVGYFPISRPLVAAVIVGGKYQQCTPRISGAINAKNTPDGQTTRIVPLFNDRPAIIVQLGKGGYIRNLSVNGTYYKPDQLNVIQIDTMMAAEWQDGSSRFNQTSPYCGIAIDPFSDPSLIPAGGMYPGLESYYLPGMSRSGSTAVTFEGLAIKNFPVGFIISPSGQQQNGEIIHLYHSQIQSCFNGYVITQAQSKQCEVKDLECWGPVYSLIDNNSWGVRHGDGAGSPYIDGVNIASHIHQIFNVTNYTFHGSFFNIYGEGVYKLGMLGGNAGAEIHCEVDFENGNGAGLPTPDYYYYANNTIFENCILRLYPGAVPGMRIIHNGQNVTYIGGQQTAPPLIRLVGGAAVNYPVIINMVQYYANGSINCPDYDTCYWSTVTNVKVNTDFSGYITRGPAFQQRGDFTKIKTGDPLIVTHQGRDIPGQLFWNYPLGYISKISNDTVFLTNIGVGIRDGEQVAPMVYSLKP